MNYASQLCLFFINFKGSSSVSSLLCRPRGLQHGLWAQMATSSAEEGMSSQPVRAVSSQPVPGITPSGPAGDGVTLSCFQSTAAASAPALLGQQRLFSRGGRKYCGPRTTVNSGVQTNH